MNIQKSWNEQEQSSNTLLNCTDSLSSHSLFFPSFPSFPLLASVVSRPSSHFIFEIFHPFSSSSSSMRRSSSTSLTPLSSKSLQFLRQRNAVVCQYIPSVTSFKNTHLVVFRTRLALLMADRSIDRRSTFRLNGCSSFSPLDLFFPLPLPSPSLLQKNLMWNTVTVQYNPLIEEEFDEHFKVTCEYGYDFWKTVTFPFLDVE